MGAQEMDDTTILERPEGTEVSAEHNHPPATEAHRLLAEAKKSLGAHSRHSKDAVKELRAFLARVMETCEYARQSDATADEVEHELLKAKVFVEDDGEWFRPLVAAAFDKKDREREKSNISKYVSVLCYAQRTGVASAGMMEWLEKPENTISALAAKEAEARRKENGTDEKRQKAFEAAVSKSRKPIELPGLTLPDGARFAMLLIEQTAEGLCWVAQATPEVEKVRGYFPELSEAGETSPQEMTA
jgi:hypothetical protein